MFKSVLCNLQMLPGDCTIVSFFPLVPLVWLYYAAILSCQFMLLTVRHEAKRRILSMVASRDVLGFPSRVESTRAWMKLCHGSP